MRHHTINLRHSTALSFGDADQAQAYELEVKRARAAQRCPYAIAPRQGLKLHDGRTLRPGDEVCVGDFSFDAEAGPAWRQLEALVARGIVLEADRWPSDPEAA